VYVGEAASARGLSFEVVFVPGLAERLFPQKVLEDPLLRDRERSGLSGLTTSADRIAQERLALRLAVGAARRKAVLSWPRLDLAQGRARVPSFYGLEVLRAAEGRLPAFSELSLRAEAAASARAGWPAPANARDAIDEAEHDLSLLARAVRLPEDERKGAAWYLLNVNPYLGRALRARARRWLRTGWTPADGLVKLGTPALDALRKHLPAARPYSPTALQNYAACPYKFALQAVHRLAPREVPEAIDEIDPLARGSMIHEVQYEVLSELQSLGLLPLDPGKLPRAQELLARRLAEVAEKWRDDLAPAIEGVWSDCIAAVQADLREWLRCIAEEKTWTPWRFELAFGLELAHRDSHSTRDPVRLDEGILLRGSIDLVERAPDGALRATDFKTGKAWAKPGVVVGGGATLQPALYALALQKLFPEARVEGGRLYYCTYVGDFTPVEVPLNGEAKGSVQLLAQTLSQAIEQGFLPAAPRERECERCDYLTVCGPLEETRTARKPKQQLAPLQKLRELP
jgi:ATP-dependent helicase/DNAse subunit B